MRDILVIIAPKTSLSQQCQLWSQINYSADFFLKILSEMSVELTHLGNDAGWLVSVLIKPIPFVAIFVGL